MRQSYAVHVSETAERDVDALFKYLVTAYRSFGDTPEEAFDRAVSRTASLKVAILGLGKAPFQGTLRESWMPGLLQVTKDKTIFYFTVDETSERVNVLAIFFGGQDHQRQMLKRLLGGD